jgi:hypothetical protein
MARLGPVFDAYFAAFLNERGPRTHYLRDVPRELLDWCAPQWRSDPRVPPYMLDLANHEFLRIEIGAMPVRRAVPTRDDLDLERGVVFTDASRVAQYGYRVHELSDALDDRSEPAEGPVALFVYRSPEHVVRYLELTPLAAGILQRLRDAGMTLRQAIQQACADHGAALDDAVLSGTARVLSDLAERGALLGSRND